MIKIPTQLAIALVLAFSVSIQALQASAQSGERSGKEVVKVVCSTCHGTGANGAPKIGDVKAWSKRASQGLTSLTQHAVRGIRQMPAHGGNPDITDLEIGRAITYMVNRSGGHWVEPVDTKVLTAERSGQEVVHARCANCHETGKNNAPKIGDRDAWRPRLKQGLDILVRSAIRGHGGMPPRGGMADLSDPEIRAAIVYMFNQGSPTTDGPSVAQALAPPQSNHKVVEGIEIYLGVIAAESIRTQHPRTDAESSMHGGIPSGKGYYHVNISLFDQKTKADIADAQVAVRVTNLVQVDETKRLELMVVNNKISHGNYFRMLGKGPYMIVVHILRPGMSQAIEAKFDFKEY